jgi:hypothetical protein
MFKTAPAEAPSSNSAVFDEMFGKPESVVVPPPSPMKRKAAADPEPDDDIKVKVEPQQQQQQQPEKKAKVDSPPPPTKAKKAKTKTKSKAKAKSKDKESKDTTVAMDTKDDSPAAVAAAASPEDDVIKNLLQTSSSTTNFFLKLWRAILDLAKKKKTYTKSKNAVTLDLDHIDESVTTVCKMIGGTKMQSHASLVKSFNDILMLLLEQNKDAVPEQFHHNVCQIVTALNVNFMIMFFGISNPECKEIVKDVLHAIAAQDRK